MTRSARAGALLRRAPWVAAVGVAVVMVLAVVDRAAVVVHQCVAGDALAARVGLRLALLRDGGACPEGSLAVGADSRQVLGVVVVVALPVLLGHAAALGVALGAFAGLRLMFAAALGALAGRARRVPRAGAPVVDRVSGVPVVGRTWSVVPGGATGSPWRRGPPALQLA